MLRTEKKKNGRGRRATDCGDFIEALI